MTSHDHPTDVGLGEKRQPRDWLPSILTPNAVALVGASEDPLALGGRAQGYLAKYGFPGRVYPVNPNRSSVQNMTSFPSVESLPERVDAAFIVVRAERVPAAVLDCAQSGVRVAIVGSGGFAELGPAGAELQRNAVEIAREHGMRLIGPNCNGVISALGRFTGTFTPGLDQDTFALTEGPLALVSQSGALGSAVFCVAQTTGLGVGTYLSTGNEADVSFEELLLELLAMDPIDGVLGYVEGLHHAETLTAAAEIARARGKYIVLLKSGVTPAGAAAVASHTASLAGEKRVYDGVFEQLGILSATSITQLLGIGRMLRAYNGRVGTRLVIASQSGGLGILLSDLAVQNGLQLARPVDGASAAAGPPASLLSSNPIDLGGDIFRDFDRLGALLETLDEAPGSDVIVVGLTNYARRQAELADFFIDTAKRLHKPLLIVWAGTSAEAQVLLDRALVPCFADPARCIEALAPVARRARGEWAVVSTDHDDGHATAAAFAAEVAATARSGGQQALDEVTSKAILTSFGIRTVPERTVGDPAGCADAVRELGFPVVAKLRSPSLLHKSDIGGVRLALDSLDAVQDAVTELLAVAERHALPDADVVLQSQVPDGLELLMGMKNDATFGPTLIFGIGGVMAEAFDDVVVRLPLLARSDIDAMISGLTHRSLLEGFRGLPALTSDRIEATLQAFASLIRMAGKHFSFIDVNPVILSRDGGAPVVVDCSFGVE